ncbi:hypothetical protein [Maribacter antarcticus]|uniref:hypothetical protein n=1 Tax=Maribacter antarcticus TaxID=505250 RepID=UPI00047E0F33|nr:hypothetical protein [Maribacter antarcticus]
MFLDLIRKTNHIRKLVFSLIIVACLEFVGCFDDDDDNICASCSVDFLGTAITTASCDNGDDIVTVSILGETQVLTAEEHEGVSAAEYVQALEDGCGSL